MLTTFVVASIAFNLLGGVGQLATAADKGNYQLNVFCGIISVGFAIFGIIALCCNS
jgi:aspartate ammonia-lyase